MSFYWQDIMLKIHLIQLGLTDSQDIMYLLLDNYTKQRKNTKIETKRELLIHLSEQTRQDLV